MTFNGVSHCAVKPETFIKHLEKEAMVWKMIGIDHVSLGRVVEYCKVTTHID